MHKGLREPVAWRYLARGIWSVTNIKGAAEFWQSEGCVVEPLYTAPAQSDAELRTDDGTLALIAGRKAALAQSDAEPVAWRYAYPDYPDHWNVTSDKLTADERRGNAGCIVEPLYAAPPRPDASAGLIEAAEWHDAEAQKFCGVWTVWHVECARQLRARAADRSGK